MPELVAAPLAAIAEARERARLGCLLGPTDLMLLFGLSRSAFHRWKSAGKFDQFKVKAALGPKCYSGALVDQLLRAEEPREFSFGRHHPRRA